MGTVHQLLQLPVSHYLCRLQPPVRRSSYRAGLCCSSPNNAQRQIEIKGLATCSEALFEDILPIDCDEEIDMFSDDQDSDKNSELNISTVSK